MITTYLFREKVQPSLAYKTAKRNTHQTQLVLYDVFLNTNGHLKRKGTFTAVTVGVNVEDNFLEDDMINWVLQKDPGLKRENVKIEVLKKRTKNRIGEK